MGDSFFVCLRNEKSDLKMERGSEGRRRSKLVGKVRMKMLFVKNSDSCLSAQYIFGNSGIFLRMMRDCFLSI